MKVLFIGTLYPKERENEIKSCFHFYDIPGNVLQWTLLNGFDKHALTNVVAIPTLGRTPGRLKSSRFSHKNDSDDYCVGFYNLPVIKELTASHSARHYIASKNYDYIFIYSIGPSSLKIASEYKKKHPDVKIVQMITDLPEFMNSSSNFIYRLLKNTEIRVDYNLMQCVDGFVLLAPPMAQRLPIDNKPWICVEGIYTQPQTNEYSIKESKRVLFYSGNLDARYGMMDLMDAFCMTNNDDFRLWICGDGDTVPEIKKRQTKDSRIEYKGCLSREDVLALQKKATLLVNPRHSTEEYTQYSFPSKTMEYMASGTPTLMSRLKSLPDDYLQYLYTFDDESVEGMSDTISKILSKPFEELSSFGAKSSEFILKNKNSYKQVERIVDFFKSL